MKFAYADPPYIGMAKRFYSHDPRCAEVDHNDLMKMLCDTYEGWALSCTSTTLKQILCMPNCPSDIRIGAWVKPFASWKPGINPAYAWEPVLFYGGRARGKDRETVRDWISDNIMMQTGLVGSKPRHMCYWLFEMLGALPTDEFADLYPGSGAVTRAWQDWRIAQLDKAHQQPLFAQI